MKTTGIRRKRKGAKFKGVTKAPRGYRVMIQRARKVLFSGYFDSAHEAAEAYDREARKLFGKHARLNFPREGELKA